VGAVLLEQHEHWQLEGRRMFYAESMAAIPELDGGPALQPPGCTDHSSSQHIRIQTKDLTSQSSRFIVAARGALAPPE